MLHFPPRRIRSQVWGLMNYGGSGWLGTGNPSMRTTRIVASLMLTSPNFLKTSPSLLSNTSNLPITDSRSWIMVLPLVYTSIPRAAAHQKGKMEGSDSDVYFFFLFEEVQDQRATSKLLTLRKPSSSWQAKTTTPRASIQHCSASQSQREQTFKRGLTEKQDGTTERSLVFLGLLGVFFAFGLVR